MTVKVKNIKKACKITDKVFFEIVNNFSKFKTEKDVERFFNKRCRELNAKKAFPIIVAAGKKAFQIHHKPREYGLKKGFCVIDMGARVNGYCSDMTRTIYVGKPSPKERRLYGLVLNCQVKSSNKLKPGARCSDIDKFSRNCLGKWKKYFRHGLGHGVGKRIHEKPSFKPKSEDIVKTGDVLTIEPGIYMRNKRGIRIEDTILVGRKKIEILTKSSKKLICV